MRSTLRRHRSALRSRARRTGDCRARRRRRRAAGGRVALRTARARSALSHRQQRGISARHRGSDVAAPTRAVRQRDPHTLAGATRPPHRLERARPRTARGTRRGAVVSRRAGPHLRHALRAPARRARRPVATTARARRRRSDHDRGAARRFATHRRRRRSALADVRRRLGETPALRTFPCRRPIFALDRLWLQPRSALLGVRVVGTRLARAASDHLPLRAEITLAGC